MVEEKTTKTKKRTTSSMEKETIAQISIVNSKVQTIQDASSLIYEKVENLNETVTTLDREVSEDLSMLAHGMDDFEDRLNQVEREVALSEGFNDCLNSMKDDISKLEISYGPLSQSVFDTRKGLAECVECMETHLRAVNADIAELDKAVENLNEDMDEIVKNAYEYRTGTNKTIEQMKQEMEAVFPRITRIETETEYLRKFVMVLNDMAEPPERREEWRRKMLRESLFHYILAGGAVAMALIGMLASLLL